MEEDDESDLDGGKSGDINWRLVSGSRRKMDVVEVF